jgi:hypothetical protein
MEKMINLKIKTKEVNVELEYNEVLGKGHSVKITGTGDFSHHLIEGLFEIVERLSKMENCCHRKEEYK